MVRIFLTFTLITLVWLGGSLSGNNRVVASQSDPSKIFDEYPTNPNFRMLLWPHLNLEKLKYDDQPLILYATWFSGDTSGEVLEISTVGRTFSFRHVPNWAIQASHQGQLSSEELTKLHQQLLSMPKSSTRPEVKNLLVFSYVRNGEWVTELFERNKLTNDLIEIFRVGSARSPVPPRSQDEGKTGANENNH